MSSFKKACILLILCFFSTLWAVDVVGIVVEEGSDRAVPYAEIRYISGKALGSADGRGRFSLEVESKNSILQVIRPGYDTTRVELQDYGDLLDVVIALRSSLRDLGQTQVRARQSQDYRSLREIPMGALEDAAGMRFDITEHLNQLPGMSGQRDFSSELSYDGARSYELNYHLGYLPIPNMRHLDVGFPGNLSVLNPHALRGIEISDHYATGPHSQGLAGAVQFIPDPGLKDEFNFKASVGTTLREIYATGPWLFGDAFVFSFRWLDPAMLKNMGEKFFTEFRKRDATCTDCHIQSSNPFDLSSRDFFLHLGGQDTSGSSWGFNAVHSQDKYAIHQDTSTELSTVNSATLVQGHLDYTVLGLDYTTAGGSVWHLGWINTMSGDTLRDTTSFRSDAEAAGNDDFRNFIDGGHSRTNEFRTGLDSYLPWQFLGANELSWALNYGHIRTKRNFADSGKVLERKFNYHDLSLMSKSQWRKSGWHISAGLGLLTSLEKVAPLASVDVQRKLGDFSGLSWFGNTAWRAQVQEQSEESFLHSHIEQGGSAKLGLKLEQKGLSAQVHGFGRYYPNPSLAAPPAFWHYSEQSQAQNAWVSGVSATVSWRTLHHFALQTNASSVYGHYRLTDGSALPWQANARLDMLTHLRIYPRTDSLLSVIVTHQAAWNRPLYQWFIHDHQRTLSAYPEFTDLYRTDLRLNLDLASSWKPQLDVRFYVEVNNIFSPLQVSWLRWLGGDNPRERSMVTYDDDGNSENGYYLVPFMAKGLGLYAQFGVEGTLGF
ncbi:MAG: TonB-dependent receptor [Fibrobacter sp.]|nr:TonB-dependent receptor [Fibrobacter sp.]